jgi:hypothetical protein
MISLRFFCVRINFTCLSDFSTENGHVLSDRGGRNRPQMFNKLSCFQKCYLRGTTNFWMWKRLHFLIRYVRFPSPTHINFQKVVLEIVHFPCMGSVILDALIRHDNHRFMSCDSTSFRIEIYNQLNAQFFIYSIIILYLDPLHVSNITCSSSGGHRIFAVSGILTLCMLPYLAPIKSGLQSARNRCQVGQHTEREDTRYCKYTMSSWRWACDARNM